MLSTRGFWSSPRSTKWLCCDCRLRLAQTRGIHVSPKYRTSVAAAEQTHEPTIHEPPNHEPITHEPTIHEPTTEPSRSIPAQPKAKKVKQKGPPISRVAPQPAVAPGKKTKPTGKIVGNDQKNDGNTSVVQELGLIRSLIREEISALRKSIMDDMAAKPIEKPTVQEHDKTEPEEAPPLSLSLMSLEDAMNKVRQPRKIPPRPDFEKWYMRNGGENFGETLIPTELELTPVPVEQPPVPTLQYGLDRVLFNSGVYQLQDPHSRVYNFDPYLQRIMPVTDFNFNSLKEYKTSSHDTALADIAATTGKRYIGSTSSMTSCLAHFHFLLSNFRGLNFSMLSRSIAASSTSFTKINRAPNAIFLRWQNGTYAIDADKEHDGPNVLMLLGKSMELLLTQSKETFERYRKDSSEPITEDEKAVPEAYHYTTLGDFLMRSQLDAYDPRLPGTGMFDLKTRAVVSVRMNVGEYEEMAGYEIQNLHGNWESYEREFLDMLRSTMLKYSLQARMGRMDGIFVAYHNSDRIFGFQYLPISQLDLGLHGQADRCLGDQEFIASITMLNKALNMATEKFPEQSLRVHFETKPGSGDAPATMTMFAEPMTEEEIDRIQAGPKDRISEYEKEVMGMERESATSVSEEGSDGPAQADETSQALSSTMESSDLAVDDASAKPLDVESGDSDVDSTLTTLSNTESSDSNADDTSSATSSISQTDDAETHTGKHSGSSNPADADPGFLDELASSHADAEVTHGPLFMATLSVLNSIRPKGNPGAPWRECGQNRPANLKPEHEWQVSFCIREESEDLALNWARYEDTKWRRREAFAKGEEDEEDRARQNYVDFLRRLSESGRRYRETVDRAEEGVAKVSL